MSEQQRSYWHYEWPGHVGREVIKDAQGQPHPHHCLVKARTQCPPLISSYLAPLSRLSEAERLALQAGLLGWGSCLAQHLLTCASAPEQMPAPLWDYTSLEVQGLGGSENLAPSFLAVSAKVTS